VNHQILERNWRLQVYLEARFSQCRYHSLQLLSLLRSVWDNECYDNLLSYRFKYHELVPLSWESFGMTAINDLVMWVNRLRMILYINALLLMVH